VFRFKFSFFLLLEINTEIVFSYILKFIINSFFCHQKLYRMFPVTVTYLITSWNLSHVMRNIL